MGGGAERFSTALFLSFLFITPSFADTTTPEVYTDYLNELTGPKVTWETATESDSDIVLINGAYYKYTYNSRDLATDYNFNTMAFIYGNMPEVYAAMNLFGVTSAYKLEGESYSGYRNFAGTSKPIAPVHRSYIILDNVNSVTYTADSQSSSMYKFTFSNN